MRRILTRYVVLALCAAFMAAPACGDDSAPSLPLQDVEDSYTNFFCQAVIDCDIGFGPLLQDTQECRDFMVAFEGPTTSMGETVAAVNRGDVAYSGTRAARCISDLEALGCDVFASPSPESCEDVFEGSLGLSTACDLNEECDSGWCDTRDTCPGQCAQPVGDGGSCADKEACDTGLVCLNDTCQPHPGPQAVGRPCDLEESLCVHTAYCDSVTETCTALGQENDPCDSEADDESCGGGMFCITDVCTAVSFVENQGDACSMFDGIMCHPLSGFGCVHDFSTDPPVGVTCEPLLGSGAECVNLTTRIYTPCDGQADLYCDFDTQTCVSKKAGGQSCEDNDECLSDMCEGTPGQCEDQECWQQ